MSNFPRGVIVEWFGAIGEIPAGWVLCNGANGTPDLRNRFIVGAGDTYAVNEEGGAINHNHPFTEDGHQHDIGPGELIAAGVSLDAVTDTTFAAGTTDNANGLPPYHALAFIMKT